MFKVSVMYPNENGAQFDFDYYRATHIKMAEEAMRPFGLVRVIVEKGVSGGAGQPAPYICVTHLFFEREEGYEQSIEAHGPKLRADFVNYTNLSPVRLFSEVLEDKGFGD
ncbi:MAG: EthD family reductase [SAR324 cluster bacterium]|nr:EthD family reductase [SAR324 cluster bacterium]